MLRHPLHLTLCLGRIAFALQIAARPPSWVSASSSKKFWYFYNKICSFYFQCFLLDVPLFAWDLAQIDMHLETMGQRKLHVLMHVFISTAWNNILIPCTEITPLQSLLLAHSTLYNQLVWDLFGLHLLFLGSAVVDILFRTDKSAIVCQYEGHGRSSATSMQASQILHIRGVRHCSTVLGINCYARPLDQSKKAVTPYAVEDLTQAHTLQVWNVNACGGIVGVFHLQGSSWDRNKRQFQIHDKSPQELQSKVCSTFLCLLAFTLWCVCLTWYVSLTW